MSTNNNTSNSSEPSVLVSKIVMLGPTGVGKTSLLAAMYPNLEKRFPGEGYSLVPNPADVKILDDLRKKLATLGEGGTFVLDGQIPPSQNEAVFQFELQYQGITDVTLKFADIPGRYCTSKNGEEAVNVLKDADISFWCIDSVTLMEGKSGDSPNAGRFHEKVNTPEAIADCLRRSAVNKMHAVCIVLMRAETYEQDMQADNLLESFKKNYSPFVKEIRENPNIGKIYYCMVQTTGNLRFNSFVSPQDSKAKYIRHQGIADDSQGTYYQYSPRYCELPVLCAVKSSLESANLRSVEKTNALITQGWWFMRWVPFFPGHKEYKTESERGKRLQQRIRLAIKEINEVLQRERLFEWDG